MSKNADKAKSIINDVIYLTLATSDMDAVPWCTPVYTAFDEDYNFYWASGFETRHSKNIQQNLKVGATIYDSSLAEGEGEAVYMEGEAKELTPKTWQNALMLLRQRCQLADKYYPIDQYQKLGPVRIYQFTPHKFFVLNPDGDSRYDVYADCRVEVFLK